MFEFLLGFVVTMISLIVGFRLGRMTVIQEKVESYLPMAKQLRQKILEPFGRKDKRTPRVNDDDAAWLKENDL